jgi:hypothetical protein
VISLSRVRERAGVRVFLLEMKEKDPHPPPLRGSSLSRTRERVLRVVATSNLLS